MILVLHPRTRFSLSHFFHAGVPITRFITFAKLGYTDTIDKRSKQSPLNPLHEDCTINARLYRIHLTRYVANYERDR